jgi:hypothetical protein
LTVVVLRSALWIMISSRGWTSTPLPVAARWRRSESTRARNAFHSASVVRMRRSQSRPSDTGTWLIVASTPGSAAAASTALPPPVPPLPKIAPRSPSMSDRERM